MAARKTGNLNASWRERIQTSMLINRLQDHVKGKVELSPTQVTAALGLLKKTAPDLTAAEFRAEITHNYVARIPTISQDMEAWTQEHGQALMLPDLNQQ